MRVNFCTLTSKQFENGQKNVKLKIQHIFFGGLWRVQGTVILFRYLCNKIRNLVNNFFGPLEVFVYFLFFESSLQSLFCHEKNLALIILDHKNIFKLYVSNKRMSLTFHHIPSLSALLKKSWC